MNGQATEAKRMPLVDLRGIDEAVAKVADSVIEYGPKHATSMHPSQVLCVADSALQTKPDLRGIMSQLLHIADKKSYFSPYSFNSHLPGIGEIREKLGLPEAHNDEDYDLLLDISYN